MLERFNVSAKSKHQKNQKRLNHHQRQQLDGFKNNHLTKEFDQLDNPPTNTFELPNLSEDQYLELVAKCKNALQHNLYIAVLKTIDDQLIAESNCYADFMNQKKIMLSTKYDIDNDLLFNEITDDNVCRYLYDNCTSTKIKDKGFDNLQVLFSDNCFIKQQLKNKSNNIYSITDKTLRQICDLRIWFCLGYYYPNLKSKINLIVSRKYPPVLLSFLNQIIEDSKISIFKNSALVVKHYPNYQSFLDDLNKKSGGKK